MEHTGKIRIYKVEDRERVAGILSGEGYAVWQGTETVKRRSAHYVYYRDLKEEQESEGKVRSPGGAPGEGPAPVLKGREQCENQDAG